MKVNQRVAALEGRVQEQPKEIKIHLPNAKTPAQVQADVRKILYQLM